MAKNLHGIKQHSIISCKRRLQPQASSLIKNKLSVEFHIWD